MATTTLRISGMTCGHCVQAVAGALKNVPGVDNADVDLQAGNALVEYDENRTSPSALAAAVEEEGYSAAPAPR